MQCQRHLRPRTVQGYQGSQTLQAMQEAALVRVVHQGRGEMPPESICPMCKGAKYLRVNVPYGHPRFGKIESCECKKAEQAKMRRQQLSAMSNLAALRDKGFANFNWRVPGVQEAFQVAREFADHPAGWLLFIGPNGCGKTPLAAAIANQCLDQEMSVLFVTVPDLLDHLRATFAPTSTITYDELFSRVRKAELLVLDDLGTEQLSPWVGEKLFQLFNHRYNWRLPTVITTNDVHLQTVDARIRSRLTDSSLVREVGFAGARDYRPHSSFTRT